MDYKERIEAAKEQLKAADAVECKLPDSAHAIRTAVYAIYPELCESEDERIRKELIEHVKDQQSSFISPPDCRDKYEEEENNKYNSWIAWLEKQATPQMVEDAFLKGCNDTKKCLLKRQSEQKPTDEDMKEALRTEYEKGRADTIAQMQKEWSEEDELNLKQAIYVCHQNGYTAVENWLKSIKERYTWKPSDDQMEAIRIAAEVGTANNS